MFCARNQVGCPFEDYATRSEVEKVKEENIKTVLEVATRRVVRSIIEEPI